MRKRYSLKAAGKAARKWKSKTPQRRQENEKGTEVSVLLMNGSGTLKTKLSSRNINLRSFQKNSKSLC